MKAIVTQTDFDARSLSLAMPDGSLLQMTPVPELGAFSDIVDSRPSVGDLVEIPDSPADETNSSDDPSHTWGA